MCSSPSSSSSSTQNLPELAIFVGHALIILRIIIIIVCPAQPNQVCMLAHTVAEDNAVLLILIIIYPLLTWARCLCGLPWDWSRRCAPARERSAGRVRQRCRDWCRSCCVPHTASPGLQRHQPHSSPVHSDQINTGDCEMLNQVHIAVLYTVTK